jgi:hypothetical protein
MIFNRTHIARLYYGIAILLLLLRFKSHVLLSQLQNPVLTFVNTDITYIAFAFLGITKAVAHVKLIALFIDVSLFASAIVCFIFPKRRLSSLAFTVLLGIYIVTGYTLLCFHKHNMTGLWITSLMFLVSDGEGFGIMFDLTRYYCLFTYFSSGIWKFYRHVWHYPGHLPVILKNDAMPYAVEHTVNIHTSIVAWLIIHPGLMDTMMLFTAVLQLSYFIGFFTRKLDWFFLAFAIAFHLAAFYLLQAYFLDFSVILLTLLPWRRVKDEINKAHGVMEAKPIYGP